MPPRRAIDDDEEITEEEEEEEIETTSGSEEESSVEDSAKGLGAGTTGPKEALLVNKPNDEKYVVEGARHVQTPPDNVTGSKVLYKSRPESPRGMREGNKPETSLGSQSLRQAQSPQESLQIPSDMDIRKLRNNPNDEMVRVEDALNIPTPRGKGQEEAGGLLLRNAPHDEAIPLSTRGSSVGTPRKQTGEKMGAMSPTDEGSSADEEAEEVETQSRGYINQRPEAIDTEAHLKTNVIPNLEYKPQDYAKINSTASREMQELFKCILDYQPVIPDLPAKLRPFIPDYVPSIGDLDPFCKISRPDGRPDGLGLFVLDEPSVSQSNPAVVLLELRATNIHSSGGLAEVVDSFEDAANRPEVIDRWIADVKKVHYKKPLPTTNYQMPMPEIESLLQVWPPVFEDFLNSDIQFPPPTIDMDLDQYVRTLCCILDIPTYNSLVDSLHVMFTLYQEFRANQHFQHE
ncbi:hypothetical protein C3747_28g233 [Trypanosoma cruzi]|uniref:Intraflagellar transport complex B protein 46 C terminal n=2 Tax=Trypanosoma cruzi TaxID=5693 RepID=Q4DZ68_TRYCC|nr:hypothetical protein, conserved [Trypanosoma cruzi]EAN97824.1 hypothetical protein, conserved [Trypanosoma cruzi]PWV15733.1 hypothetical protein C3747_28g233 [Trypanosoma cruzi]RNC49352.1 hypothetical protein TcCL_NonESM00579 [Trypanosoma cruzi]|eukprot:XP_819675.1 hypothetical protein [Trypanosoma cruzi strain CL Brener]